MKDGVVGASSGLVLQWRGGGSFRPQVPLASIPLT